MNWQIQEAKNRFSELLREARSSGPQVITHRGEEEAVVVSIEEYRRLTGEKDDLVSFLQRSPWAEIEIDVERSKDLVRETDL